MRTAFVTGAAGGMGHRLVRGLAAAGWQVRGLVLPGDRLRARLDGTGCEVVSGDVQDRATLAGKLDGVDTVFHLAAVILSPDPGVFERVNRLGTENVVAAAAAAGVRHFVYVSSASVTYPRLTAYAASKLAGETAVKAERRFAHTIVRPTLVYDETGGEEFALYRRYLLRFPVVPFVGMGRAKKRPVHSQDIVDGLLAVAGNERAHGKTYNLSGPEAITMREMSAAILEHAGASRPFLPLPVPLCRAAAAVMAIVMRRPPLTPQSIAGIVNDADLDPAEAMRDLGYRPRRFREGLALRSGE